MGALLSFKNDSLKLQLVNDKSLLNLNISASNEENFFDADLVNSLLLLEKDENLKIGQFAKRQIIMKRLDLEEQAALIRDNWERLILLFNHQNINSTKIRLDKLGIERAEITFGKSVFKS
ncbi:hypothetical protein [Adhaeribacter terreus]|uniref:Uncharacterized protein n=1 Tax=Adhaeribacter terreus TaxID=529703 RepID=A0ABW0EG80_9BACT